jgi:hypothetical protein
LAASIERNHSAVACKPSLVRRLAKSAVDAPMAFNARAYSSPPSFDWTRVSKNRCKTSRALAPAGDVPDCGKSFTGCDAVPQMSVKWSWICGADRRWLGAHLELTDGETLAIDDAKTGFFKTDIQPNVKLHRSSPVLQRTPKSLHQAPDSATRRLSSCTGFSKPDLKSRPAVVVSRSLFPRVQLPSKQTLGTRGDLRQNAVLVMRWILPKRLPEHVGW